MACAVRELTGSLYYSVSDVVAFSVDRRFWMLDSDQVRQHG